MDASKPGSPLWWLHRLEAQLGKRRVELELLDSYYEGDHPLAFASVKFQQAFGGLFAAFADNWCDLVVDAVEERLNVEGFRFGDTRGDADAWRIWQANQLDAESHLAHVEALVKGTAYAIVWAGEDEKTPSITVEDPLEVIAENTPGARLRRAAAVKIWRDDWDRSRMATVYLPDGIYKYRASSALSGLVDASGVSLGGWAPREVPGETWPLRNPLGVVPVVPIHNRPRLSKPAVSEIARVVPLQDAVNKLVADMLVASEFAAFRQRWVTGMEIPLDPETGQPVETFRAAVDRIFAVEDPNTKFGEFSATELSNFVAGIEMLVQHIASQTRTPPHYFYLRGEFPSGESIKSAETGLVSKAKRKQRFFGEAWEEAMRLAFRVAGDDAKAALVGAETIWRDAETRTESEHVDAVLKRQALGVPAQQLWEDAGYTQTQIARFKDMAREEAALGATADLAALFARSAVPPPAGVPVDA